MLPIKMKYITFGLIGLCNLTIGTTVFHCVYNYVEASLLAGLAAYLCATAVSSVLHSSYCFKQTLNKTIYFKFLLSQLAILLLTSILIDTTVLISPLAPWIAWMTINILITPINYLVCKNYVYR